MMMEAAYPHLFTAVGWWVAVFTVFSVILTVLGVITWAEEGEHVKAELFILLGVWIVGMIVLTVVTILLHHAAWVDYQRSLVS